MIQMKLRPDITLYVQECIDEPFHEGGEPVTGWAVGFGPDGEDWVFAALLPNREAAEEFAATLLKIGREGKD